MSRHGHSVELSTISKIKELSDGYEIDRSEGWGTLWLSKDECNGFVPQDGDAVVIFTRNFSQVVGVIIENHVIRYKTTDQFNADRKAMLDGFRLDKLERYVKFGDTLKARVDKLHPALKARMERFAAVAETPEDFWIEDAPYEMICLQGATALLNKVEELGYLPNLEAPISPNNTLTLRAIEWINDWWEQDYNRQMELVPDFGEGHSGFTASAAKGLAIMVLEGKDV